MDLSLSNALALMSHYKFDFFFEDFGTNCYKFYGWLY